MRNRNRPRRHDAGGHGIVRRGQGYVPTKPTKAVVAAVVTIAGLAGIHLTTGTAQLVVMVGQLALVVYGVWRAHNAPKDPPSGPGVQEFLT